MTPFLVATLLALLIVGVLHRIWRHQQRRGLRLALVVIAMVVAVLAVYATRVAGGKLARADADLVTLEELELVEVAGSFRLTGLAGNRSEALVLTSLPLLLKVEDCNADDACRTQYEGEQEVRVTVPPGERIAFRAIWPAQGDLRVRGERRWQVTAGNPRARKP